MTSLSSMDHPMEQDPKESKESRIAPGQSKHNSNAAYQHEPLKKDEIEEHMLVVSLLNNQHEEGINSKDVPQQFKDVANGYSLPTVPPQFDENLKIALGNGRLDKSSLKHYLPIDLLKELQYFPSKAPFVTSEYVSPSPLSSTLSPLLTTPQFYLFLKSIIKVNQILFRNVLKQLKMSSITEFYNTNSNPEPPNNADKPVLYSFTTSSKNNFSEVLGLLNGQTVTEDEEESVGILNGATALLPANDADDDQTSAASAFVVTTCKDLEPIPPTRHLRDSLQHSNLYVCSHCEILYIDEFLYDLHMYAHGMGDPFTCVCGQTNLRGRVQFNSHIIMGEHLLPVQFQSAPEAGSPLLMTNSRRRHWMTLETPYECLQCKILYRNFHIFVMHKVFHNSSGPFVCNRVGCVVYHDSYAFNVHLFTNNHTGRMVILDSDSSDSDENN